MSDVRKLFDPETGDLLPPKDWPEEAAAAVASFEVVTREVGQGEVQNVAKVKILDKVRTLEMLGRHIGLLRTGVEISGEDRNRIVPLEMTYRTPEALKAEILELLEKV